MNQPRTTCKSRMLATWLALLGGTFGLHRFYLNGLSDRWAWMHPVLALPGLYGIARARQFGLDDHWSWLLIPLLGIAVSVAMLTAIVYGLMTDEKWNARYNPEGRASQGGWAAVLGAALGLLIGGGVLMATLAFSSQRYFEYQVESAHRPGQ